MEEIIIHADLRKLLNDHPDIVQVVHVYGKMNREKVLNTGMDIIEDHGTMIVASGNRKAIYETAILEKVIWIRPAP
jgi:hypothetical protein